MQVGVAGERIFVQRGFVGGIGQFQCIGALAEQIHPGGHVGVGGFWQQIGARIAGNVGGAADRVAHGGRPQQRQHHIGAVLVAPAAQGFAKASLVRGQARRGGDVDQPAQAQGGIQCDAHQVGTGAGKLALQQVIDHTDHVFQVAKHIADRRSRRLGRHGAIAARQRLQGGAVNHVVKSVNLAVGSFVGVEAVLWGGGGAACQQADGQQSREDAASASGVTVREQGLPLHTG